MNLVVVSLEAWDEVWRRNQHFVSRLLSEDEQLRVLFVEPAADPLHDLLSRRPPRIRMGPVEEEGFAGRLSRFRPVKPLPRRIDRHADERLARSIRDAASSTGATDPVLWLNDPRAAPLARLTGWTTLYDITDDWVAADRPAAELDRTRAEERWLMRHADAVVACSRELVRRKTADRGGAIHLIPNAVDVAAYREPRPRPADLPAGAAVYVGTLHTDRLDVALCQATATALAGRGALVLVGPDALRQADAARLREAGVILLGSRSRDDVIGYLQHADVLVVPHVVTPFTESLDPIKSYEYAAVGRPVVSTPVAGFRDAGDPRVRVAAASDFASAVADLVPAVTRFPEGADRSLAGWDDRAQAMRAVIDGMLRAKRSAG